MIDFTSVLAAAVVVVSYWWSLELEDCLLDIKGATTVASGKDGMSEEDLLGGREEDEVLRIFWFIRDSSSRRKQRTEEVYLSKLQVPLDESDSTRSF